MRTIGRHIIMECSGCNPEILNNLERVQSIIIDAALAAKAEVRERAFHRFTPQGVSGVVVISESHISVHTWPEYGYAALDIYTCGQETLPQRACDYVLREFQAQKAKLIELKRGIPKEGEIFTNEVVFSEEKDVPNAKQVALVSRSLH